MFSNVSSNPLPCPAQSHIGCISLTFLQSVFSNVSSNDLSEILHSFTSCICLISLHFGLSDVSSDKMPHMYETSSQAPSYASRLQSETMTHSLTYSLTGVKCRATSVAKNVYFGTQWLSSQLSNFSPVCFFFFKWVPKLPARERERNISGIFGHGWNGRLSWKIYLKYLDAPKMRGKVGTLIMDEMNTLVFSESESERL